MASAGTRWLRDVDDDAPDIVMAVEANYRKFTSTRLSAILRAPGTPWYKTFHEEGPAHAIRTRVIAAYFTELFERVKARGR